MVQDIQQIWDTTLSGDTTVRCRLVMIPSVDHPDAPPGERAEAGDAPPAESPHRRTAGARDPRPWDRHRRRAVVDSRSLANDVTCRCLWLTPPM
jgi:hypothetical protein